MAHKPTGVLNEPMNGNSKPTEDTWTGKRYHSRNACYRDLVPPEQRISNYTLGWYDLCRKYPRRFKDIKTGCLIDEHGRLIQSGIVDSTPQIPFAQLFKSSSGPQDRFLSRLFGIFSEEIIREVWCKEPWSPYRYLGRPTLELPGHRCRHTLDFTLESREDGRVYVAEQKCELQFQSYRYLTLREPSQLDHHTGEAFRRFLDFARNPARYSVSAEGKSVSPKGAILVWGSVTEEGRASVLRETGLADVLSLEQIINDLLAKDSQGYLGLIEQKATWCRYLFDGLRGKS